MMHYKPQAFVRRAKNAETARTATLLEFVKWCQGREDTQTTLRTIGAYFGAEVVGLSRWNAEKKTLRLASTSEVGRFEHNLMLDRAYADTVCGDYIDSLKPGAAVLLSELSNDSPVADPYLANWMFKRHIRDVGIVCLGKRNRNHDLLELHFGAGAERNSSDAHEILTRSLADVYAGRREGLMLGVLIGATRRAKLVNSSINGNQQLLSLANPAGLTRTEWQVCALIANGLSREGVAKELAIKLSTVQTHLRNIYAKSGFERFHQLALHLVSTEERAHLESTSAGIAA